MRVEYSEDVDALYITLKDADIVESDEVSNGVIVDYGDDNNIVGIEILWASEKEDIIQLIIQAIKQDRIIVLRPESKPDHNESINSLRMLMSEIHSQTKDIPSEMIEHEIEEAIRKIRSRKHYAKSGF